MEEKRTEAAIRAAVEAILFAAGGSVETARLASALELDSGEMRDILRRMELRYEEEDRGILQLQQADSPVLFLVAQFHAPQNVSHLTGVQLQRRRKPGRLH